jgi:hypothetical protein
MTDKYQYTHKHTHTQTHTQTHTHTHTHTHTPTSVGLVGCGRKLYAIRTRAIACLLYASLSFLFLLHTIMRTHTHTHTLSLSLSFLPLLLGPIIISPIFQNNHNKFSIFAIKWSGACGISRACPACCLHRSHHHHHHHHHNNKHHHHKQ